MQVHTLRGASLPPRLRDLPEPPEELYAVGHPPRGPCVAIVGTRAATRVGLAYARHLAGALAAEGVVIASGGALGVDTAAHRGALDVRGRTVVVAPSSPDRPYPAKNARLFRRIVECGGALLSAYEKDVPASPPLFFQRNAFLAALADVVVVIETRYRGGARNTCAHARSLGRPVFVVPPAPWNPAASGAFEELRLGARLLRGPRDVLDVLRQQRLHPLPLRTVPPPPFVIPTECYQVVEPSPGGRRKRAKSGRRREERSVVLPAASVPPSPAGSVATSPSARPGKPARSPRSRGPGAEKGARDFLDADCLAIVRAVEAGCREPDAIVEETGLSAARVRASLLTLTLNGVLVCLASGQVRLLTA